MRLVIRQAWSRNGFDIWLLKERGPNGYWVAKPTAFEFVEKDETFMLPEPTFSINRHEYESLTKSITDEMISNGFAKSSALLDGELKATKVHLDDMRKLVFK